MYFHKMSSKKQFEIKYTNADKIWEAQMASEAKICYNSHVNPDISYEEYKNLAEIFKRGCTHCGWGYQIKSDSDDSECDDSECDDSECDDSECDNSECDNSECDDSECDNSECDDSECDNSECDDSD
jgi:hypothetical protein